MTVQFHRNTHQIKNAVVRAPNAGFAFGELLETSMVENLTKRGVHAESFLSLFPPTREWTNEEVAKELMREGFDSIMYINLVGSDTNSQTVGFINNGTASAYGNTASYSGSSTAITAISRYTSTRVKVYDIVTGRVIWVADSSTKAGGLLYVGDETQTDSIAAEIVDALAVSGHL